MAWLVMRRRMSFVRSARADVVMLLGWVALSLQASAVAQEKIDATKTFEVASVRQLDSSMRPIPRIVVLPNGRFRAITSPRELIRFAYGLESFHRIEGSARILDQLFEVVALASGDTPSVARSDVRHMVKALLNSRFELKVQLSEERRSVEILRPVSDERFGTKLVLMDKQCRRDTTGPVRLGTTSLTLLQRAQAQCAQLLIEGELAGVFADGAAFASFLSSATKRAVLDETGLRGPFQAELRFDHSTAVIDRILPTDYTRMPFRDALRQQLGLLLVTESRAIEVIQVQHIAQPNEN